MHGDGVTCLLLDLDFTVFEVCQGHGPIGARLPMKVEQDVTKSIIDQCKSVSWYKSSHDAGDVQARVQLTREEGPEPCRRYRRSSAGSSTTNTYTPRSAHHLITTPFPSLRR